MTVRLRFWLWMLDVMVGAPLPIYLWFVGRASDATDWGPPSDLPPEDRRPW